MASGSPGENENTRRRIMKLPARQSTPARAVGAPESTGMLTRQDLAKQLRISTRTVDEWRKDQVIPCIKVGKVVLFYWWWPLCARSTAWPLQRLKLRKLKR